MTDATGHFAADRKDRDAFIHSVIGLGTIIDSFVVDRGHQNGLEVHSVTDTAVIIIHNQKTKKLITELIARPEQLRKLYSTRGEKPPRWLLNKAYKNNMLRYNEK